VAVCTNRGPDEIAPALAALEAQAGPGAVLVVLSGLPAAWAQAHRARHRGPVLEEPRPGLSRARNRALRACDDEDVLAFVDDDAEVAEGWLEALRRRWAEAPADVACIGGPILPLYSAPPPAWLSEPLLPALTVLDLGRRVRDLDPAESTVYGANVSFHAGALRRAGGFDPAYGHAGRRVFFSEEDQAQRALARMGHRIRYVPDAGVWHVIPVARLTRRSFVRRRFAYGAALGLRRARGRRAAARQALRSALGAVTAAAAGRQALVMERVVRAAENLGVLLAPLAGRRP
jgi:glycosyltransferase involved in cell wall biosynthesis